MPEEKPYGTPTAEQLAKINRFAKKPFTESEVFVFPLKMIGDALIQDRYIKIDKSLLEVCVRDANNGDVAYMLNHQWADWFSSPKGVMTKGRVFESELRESHDLPDETVAQYGWVYIPRDRVKDGVSTNEIIESIEDGSLRDHSVGVGWATSECSICGLDMWKDADCPHYPGRLYDGKLAYVIAKPPGDEFEVSGVFAGAYPTAEVMSQGGESAPATMEEVTDLATLKGIAPNTKVFALLSKDNARIMVPKGAIAKRASFSVASTLDKEGGEKLAEMKENPGVQGAQKAELGSELAEVVLPVSEVHDRLNAAIASLNVSSDAVIALFDAINKRSNDSVETPAEVVQRLTQLAHMEFTVGSVETEQIGEFVALERRAVVEALGKEMDADEILRLAKDGQTLKADLLEDVLTWGVRADGNAFARETFAEMLTTATVEQLKKFRESFQAKAKETLATGRVTVPMDKASKKARTEIPDDAYRA